MADRHLSDDDLRILVINPGAEWAPGVQERVAKELHAARARIAELERWKANAETTLAEDKRYIDEANSGALVQRVAAERDEARARIAELEAQPREPYIALAKHLLAEVDRPANGE